MSHTKRSSRRRLPVSALVLAGLMILLTAVGVVGVLYFGREGRPVATEPGAPGRLVAAQPTIDLGRVPFDKLVEARFELTNSGGDTVRLVGAPRVRMLEGC